MKNEKLKAALNTARALMQDAAPVGEPPGYFSWLAGAMSSLDNAETFFGHYEDAVAQDKDMAIHRQNIAKIQRESAATVERHHADLAARAEQRAQGQTSTPPGHRA